MCFKILSRKAGKKILSRRGGKDSNIVKQILSNKITGGEQILLSGCKAGIISPGKSCVKGRTLI
jgi:hypothetical protein